MRSHIEIEFNRVQNFIYTYYIDTGSGFLDEAQSILYAE